MTTAQQKMNVIEATGFSIDLLRSSERDIPMPAAGEIQIKVSFASLNYRDLAVLSGTYMPSLALPYVPVSDCAGIVTAVGEGVNRFAVGDRVIPSYIQGWLGDDLTQEKRSKRTLGAPLTGVLQEFIVVPATDAVPTPANLTDEEAATLPIAALTAWHCLHSGGIIAGKSVLIQGTGGVALFALQFAKALGATVVALTSTAEKTEYLKSLGADHVVNYRENPEWADAVREKTNGQGIDIVVETTGSTLSQSLNACAFGGFVGVIGFVGGHEATISIRQLIGPKIRVQGIVVGSRPMMETMIKAIDTHGIRPIISDRFALSETADAFKALKSGAKPGKIVIQIS